MSGTIPQFFHIPRWDVQSEIVWYFKGGSYIASNETEMCVEEFWIQRILLIFSKVLSVPCELPIQPIYIINN